MVKENTICDDCVNRFSCPFNAYIQRSSCGLYESDTEMVKEIIRGLENYIKSKTLQGKNKKVTNNG